MSKRRALLLPVILALLVPGLLQLTACGGAPPSTGDDTPPPLKLDGLYRGRYWLTLHDGTSEQTRQDGQVLMRFEKGKYEVEGDYPLLPPAGGGDYVLGDRSITLTDTMAHTADFDWTLILNGRFDVDVGGDGSLRLTQRDLDYGRYHELELEAATQ
jgi:hypothetical protein